MSWLKLHTDILSDPKLMRAARHGLEQLQLLPWFLAFAKDAEDSGRLSVGGVAAEPEDIADQVPGSDPASVAMGLASLLEIGVLAEDPDGCLRFAKWDERQLKPSDSREAMRERQCRSRAARRAQATDGPPNATSAPGASQELGAAKTCHALPGVTVSRPVTRQKRPEEMKDEKKLSGSVNPGESPRRDTWITPYAEDWEKRFGGPMTTGPSLAPLGRLRTKHGDVETRRRWQIWLAQAKAEYNPTAAKFESTFGNWDSPKMPAVGSGGGVSCDDVASLALWTRYQDAGLLTRRSADDYQRIGDELVSAGHYSSVDEFRAELRITQPWTLNEARSDSWAVAQISRRLSAARSVV